MGNEWIGYGEVKRLGPRPVRVTHFAQTEFAILNNGQTGEFCKDCGQLAFCPQCSGDLRGKTKCHVTMATHYRDNDCKFNSNYMHDYAREASK